MNVAYRSHRMTRDEFFGWAEAQDARYEFDGLQPVAMTGGTIGHSQITGNIQATLRTRLAGSPCRPLGPDAGIATIGDVVRYPDALITCSNFRAADVLVPGAIVVFEVISKTSGARDRIEKLREYSLVPSILRYFVVESTSVGVSVFERASGDARWTASALVAGDVVRIPELTVEFPIEDLYADTALLDTETARNEADDKRNE